MDKYSWNYVEDMVETLSSPDNTGSIGQGNIKVERGFVEEPYVLSGVELYLEHGDQNGKLTVLKWKTDKDGIGWKHDSHIYAIELPEGDQNVLGYNILSDSLYSQLTQKENICC